MAGNKPALKIKPKDDRSRMMKSGLDNCLPKSNKSSDPDLTILRKPIETSVTGFYEAFRVFESGSDEIRNLLGKECDILYECKVCRCIFRSLANFLSHKRVYCSQSFNSKIHAHFADTKFTDNDTDFILQKEKEYRKFWNKRKNGVESRDDDDPVVPPITKDLTTIVERLTENDEITQPDNNDDDVQFCFEEIPTTKVAVFKNRTNINGSDPQDTMKAQVTELSKLEARKSAVLNTDGEFVIQDLSNGPVIQISDDEDDDKIKLECKKCNITFSTQKTLKFHMKKHYESRVVYSCTDCSDVFSTSWSVYRHLYKVHKKTAAQIKRLRSSIQSKIFRIDRPPVQYKKMKAMEEAANDCLNDAEKRERENKAWVDNMEYDGVIPRCGGCGRSFERRAALAAHAHICQRRANKLRRQPSPTQPQTICDDPLEQSPDDKSTLKVKIEESEKEKKTTQEDVKLKDDSTSDDDKNTEKADSNLQESTLSITPESVHNDVKCELTEAQINDILNSLTHMLDIEKENAEGLDIKIAKNIGKNLLCELCNTGFSTLITLRKHLANHYDWARYICKICEFRCFDKNDCIHHVFDTHKIRGNKNVSKAIRALPSSEAVSNPQCEIKNNLPDVKDNHAESFTSSDSKSDSKSPSISRSTTDDENSSNKADVTQSRKRNRWKRAMLKPQKKQRTASVEDAKSAHESRNTDNDSPDDENDRNKDDIEDESPKTDIETVMQVIFGDESRSSISKATTLPAYSRPARHRMRHLRDDFEYDLSNIIKMKTDPVKESQVPPTKMATKRKQLLQNRSLAMVSVVEEPPITSTNANETNIIDPKSGTEVNGPDSFQAVFIKSSRLPPLLTPAPILKARTFPCTESGNSVQMPTLLRMPPLKTSKILPYEDKPEMTQCPLSVNSSEKEENEKCHSTEINILNSRKVSSETKIHSITFKKLEASHADQEIQVDDSKTTKSNQLFTKTDGPPRKILIIKGRPIHSSLLKQGINTEKPPLIKSINEPVSAVTDTLKGQIGSAKSIRLLNLTNLKPSASNIGSNEPATCENMPEKSSRIDAYPSLVLTTNENIGDIIDDDNDMTDDEDGDNEDGISLLNSDITNIARLIDDSTLPK